MRRTRLPSISKRKANSFVWRETRQKTELELALLRRLLQAHSELLSRANGEELDGAELLASAAIVHSLYNGVENIFKRIALEIDGALPNGQKWHSDLLLQMEKEKDIRPAVISTDLRLRLGEYMDFRHVFRHAYSFDLQWAKMHGLVVNCEDTLQRLTAELEVFFGGGDS